MRIEILYGLREIGSVYAFYLQTSVLLKPIYLLNLFLVLLQHKSLKVKGSNIICKKGVPASEVL